MQKVENLKRNGKSVANQFVITDTNCGNMTFQSYKSAICTVGGSVIMFYPRWDYSTTTSRALYDFLAGYVGFDRHLLDRHAIRKAIQSGKLGDYTVIYMEDYKYYEL